MTRVFISHASRDAATAQAIVAALEAAGQPCWISSRDVAPGANYQESIVAAIRAGRAMVLLLTDAANASDEVKKELSLASAAGVAVYPVRLGAVTPNAALSYELATRQWIEGDDVPSMAQRLVAAIDGSLPHPSAAEAPAVLDLPGKPSVAVLPFANIGGDPEQEYFADGMTEEIITALSRIRSFFVIARNSAFTYKGRTVEIRHVGRDLGVRYVVEGSVRRAGNRIRVTAQLIEAEAGNHLWADRFDRHFEDVFAIQDEITQAVASAIGPAVAEAEMHRAIHRAPTSAGAWVQYQQGLWHYAKTGPAGNEQARTLFEAALGRDPTFAAAHVGLASVYFRAGVQYLTLPMDEAARLVANHARKAMELDPDDANSRAWLAMSLLMQGDFENCHTVASQAVAMSPNCASALAVLGRACVYSGRMAEGRQFLTRAERLNPRDPDVRSLHINFIISYYYERDYEQCVAAARALLIASPDYPLTYRWLAAALGQLGRVEEAHAAVAHGIAISPHSVDSYIHIRQPWYRPADYEHMLEGLRKAGWDA